MRSFLPAFELRRPSGIEDLLDLLAREPGVWRPFAGGTDLMVLFEAGTLQHQRFVSLWGLAELRTIVAADEELSVGALATYSDLRRHAVVQAEFPMLCDAAALTGGIANQNRGTLGGNIGNGSPAADSPPALLAYDASLELVSARGARRIPYERFHTGYKTADLAPDEIIARVHLPRRPRAGWHARYRKVGTRRAQAISKVCVAAAARVDGGRVADVRLALGSVAPTVIRARRAEEALRGERLSPAVVAAALAALAADIAPIDDVRSTARYRTLVARRIVAAFLESLPATAVGR